MMEKDDTLAQLFNNYTPDLQDSDDFMDRLQRKLDAVEFIRQRQEKQLRLYRYGLLAAFALGMITSGILLSIIWTTPAEQTMPTFSLLPASLVFLQEHFRTTSFIAIAILMSASTIALITQCLELADGKILADFRHNEAK
ncbi:MAG: hypothetical protein IKC18_09250 [Bacteroidaceae bacterium]|nr:hypothetical protein [Bacteroidaceae bacterium]